MIISNIDYKINYLKTKLSQYTINDIEQSFSKHWTELTNSKLAPVSIAQCIFIDILYASVRHHIWIKLPIFQELLEYYISKEYRVKADISKSLCSRIRNKIYEYLGPCDDLIIELTEYNFIKYIFIQTLTADNQDCLTRDLGIGPYLLVQIKETIEQMELLRQDRGDTKPFENEKQNTIHQVISEISSEAVNIPWIADIYQLIFELDFSNQEFHQYLSEAHAKHVFELLIYIGKQNRHSKECKKWLYQRQKSIDADLLLEQLCSCAILYRDHVPSKIENRGPNSYHLRLSSKAYKLTASAFGLKNSNKLLPTKTIFALNPNWQSSYLKNLNSDQSEYLLSLLNDKKPIHPSSLEVVVEKLSCHQKQKDILFILDRLSKSNIAEMRIAACKALCLFSESSDASNMIKNIIESDRSNSVKSSALGEIQTRFPHVAKALYSKIPIESGKLA